jgi:two-component system, chemotaxis family, sensor kinase Cph1
VQPHGALVVVDGRDLRILHYSLNAWQMLGIQARLSDTLETILGPALPKDIAIWASGEEPQYLRTVRVGERSFQLSAHRSPQGLQIEFEAAPVDDSETLEAVYPRLRAFVDAIGAASSVQDIAELAVREISVLTAFNRTMLYSFDADGDGTVLAEANDGVLPRYLDLRFPASDIPAQARELYKSNRLRLIPNATYSPAVIEPSRSAVNGAPLDLSGAALRSVSPIHLEYMRNMGTAASMSISILIDGALWGLISSHNRETKVVNAQIRSACDFLGQIISLQIGARVRADRAVRRIDLKQIEGELLAQMSHSTDFHTGVAAHQRTWCHFVAADGVAVVSADGITALGLTPSKPELLELAQWLRHTSQDELYATDQLAQSWPQASAFANVASGLMAMSISQLSASYIMWFRQEVVRTVKWGGDPRKDPVSDRLHPRKSFDIWKQQVRMRSLPWSEVEIEAARELRSSLINFVLRRAEERAALSEKLERSNAELEAFSYSVSHDLRAPFRHIVGYADLLSHREQSLDEKSRHYLNSIVDSAKHAGRLVDDLLAFSQLGRTTLSAVKVDMQKLVTEVRQSRVPETENRVIEWVVGVLPPASGDAGLLRQVWDNLIDNALKYSAVRTPAVIRIEGVASGSGVDYSVSDNGVGFDMAYVGKLFGVFQRLHRAEHYPGTGIGLALVKRIVERHGGTVWARGALEQGATIGFSMPAARG